MRVAVVGLWHLGSVTAACLAAAGNDVVGFDPAPAIVAGLQAGRPPLHEPGLDGLVADGLASGRLGFDDDPDAALADAEVVWVCFDTPVDDEDRADVDWVREQLRSIESSLAPGTLVLVSSQVPVGFSREFADRWAERGVSVGYSPENLRLGRAIDVFRNPERVVVGLTDDGDRALAGALFAPFCEQVLWMSPESAEMTKHAINAFLATSVTFANELARICERVGADAREVEQGLKSEGRIGPKAYLSPGAPFAGGTLARDLRALQFFGTTLAVATPLVDGVLASNQVHRDWVVSRVEPLLSGPDPTVAVLGLTYKPGTSTLRRSTAVELCRWLVDRDIRVQAFDPLADVSDADLPAAVTIAGDALGALAGADVAVVATPWPEFRDLRPDDIAAAMRTPVVIDQAWSLTAVAADPRITYLAPGRPM